MNSRTALGVVDDLECEVRESIVLGGIQRQGAKLLVGKPSVPVHSEDRHRTPHLHDPVKTEPRQCALEVFDVHAALTSWRMLSDPDRKPRRSTATRVNPAARIEAMIMRSGTGASQRASISGDSSTRARSPWCRTRKSPPMPRSRSERSAR